MLEVFNLPSDGGVRVNGSLADGETFELSRLSAEGETLLRFAGTELYYDTAGKLTLAVVKVTEFVFAQGQYFRQGLPRSYWEMITRLAGNNIEILAEVDLERKLVTLVEHRGLQKYERRVMTTFDLTYYNGTVYPVEVGMIEGGDTQVIGIQPELREDDNRIVLGVGDTDRVVWVAHPLQVDPRNLDGEISYEDMGRFLKGKPATK